MKIKGIFLIKKWYKNRIENIFKKLPEAPPMEDILYVFIIIFSITFGVLMFGVSENIKNEKETMDIVRFPNKLEREVRKIVGNSPIGSMAPYISWEEKDVAAYLVAIAKKESDWGKYSPKKNGNECYNYWGYRGAYNQTKSGYSCFDSPAQAVSIVGDRLDELIDQHINTPRKMVVWKCGATCAGHDLGSVEKWIQDVDFYYRKF